jgi:hypothetical protein
MRLSEVPSMPQPQLELTYATCIPSNGGTFTANQEVRIPLNVPSECFVDLKRAYLKFNFKNTSGQAQFLDPLIGGVACIDNWRVVGGTGALLEEVIHYNNYSAVLNANKNKDILESREHEMVGAGIDSNPLGGSLWKTGETEANIQKTGITELANAGTRVITHRPNSAVFNADRYMPLGYTQGTTYISITLSANATASMVASDKGGGTATGFEASNWELHLPILRPGPEFAAMFRSAMGSGVPIQIHSVGAQNTQQSLTAGGTGGAQTLTFSTRKRSVKSIITSLRVNSAITLALANSVSAFVNCAISEYNYSVGGLRIPAQQIKSATNDKGELLSNTQLALGYYSSDLRGLDNKMLSGDLSATSSVFKQDSTYFRSAADDKGGKGSRCMFAIDLETYNAAYAGRNLSGQGLPLVLHCQTGDGANNADAVLLDCYVIHDTMFMLDGATGVIQANS